ncbi:hypothetical protein HDF26_005124 [Pedobacter cryoconitis]|uniref:Uncharacterized protein n=1 Tax=Pedobacter cryoconitis TaxID=188932 RepID=A0A7W8ZMC2_9SPHI|nr:hypothetical protein [Pedobacter cryoconitis]MBB6274642.1 hypothetical protein [Pedobacter cryoconitis]
MYKFIKCNIITFLKGCLLFTCLQIISTLFSYYIMGEAINFSLVLIAGYAGIIIFAALLYTFVMKRNKDRQTG